ncbi:pantoate--beta-alanine ligase [Fictibacillus fluitans]|uniref:Pantothenate synthetase n=1 Tax=Fictibacillus fluitans TaxID=3058422 RepID=A0ABT8HQ17_9BACL|nr:pantoate--beta-alanine ligase [Fictibacillus sp. NE201]MDN4522841.1 pantoate--beta-alanine ligase [Fictibacillus sp. NE201]
MKIIRSIREMTAYSKTQLAAGKSLGFVPTMGYLHDGHAALMQQAIRENDIVVVSSFVNPLQFGPNEDFERYPRDFARDEKVANDNGVDVVFYPEVREMYPDQPSVVLHVTKRVNALCGKTREGHFDGVATVLSKLFHLVSPTRAYFGMKDAQQVAVVQGLIKDLNFQVELVACPTVREEDGLAKSSRNVYLSPQERKEAPVLYRSLKVAAELLEKEKNITLVKEKMVEYVETETSGSVDYFEILSYPELEEVPFSGQTMIIALAVQFENARLIDNLLFTHNEREQ